MSLRVEIEKRVGNFRLEVSFTAGNCAHGLLGASGCGKSMTLQCIAGVTTPDKGRIELDGRTLFDSASGVNLAPQIRNVGFLFQTLALFPNMTVEQNLLAPLRKRPRPEARRAAADMMERFGLSELARRRPSQLSGGQRQRVALARILLTRPGLLLLDEPFSALDSYRRWQTEWELARILDGFPGTALLVSHNRDEILGLCQTATVMQDGVGHGAASVDRLFCEPRTLAECLLVGYENYSRAERIGQSRIYALDWGAELDCASVPPDGLRYVAIRACHIALADAPGKNVIPCRTLRVTRGTFSNILTLSASGVRLQNRGPSALRLELAETPSVSPGENVDVFLPENRLIPLPY